MLLNISRILEAPDSKQPFEVSLDLHMLVFGGCCPVTEPVIAVGEIRNTAGVLLMRGTVSTMLHGICDRCAVEFERPVSYPFDAVLVRTLANDDGEEDPWTFLLVGDCVDLDDIVTTVFVLSMDSKLLCSKDCKGLCFRCGKNLNDGPCDCQPETDPRLAVLSKLLKDR